MKIFSIILIILLWTAKLAFSQDTIKQERYSFHFQQTVITQTKPAFSAPYTGQNSLSPDAETQTSITSTFFGAARLWRGAEVYFNPELTGGSGLSKTTGIAGFTNGETFRVNSVAPGIYIARLFLNKTLSGARKRTPFKAMLMY